MDKPPRRLPMEKVVGNLTYHNNILPAVDCCVPFFKRGRIQVPGKFLPRDGLARWPPGQRQAQFAGTPMPSPKLESSTIVKYALVASLPCICICYSSVTQAACSLRSHTCSPLRTAGVRVWPLDSPVIIARWVPASEHAPACQLTPPILHPPLNYALSQPFVCVAQ